MPNEQVCVRLNVGAVCTYTIFGPDKDIPEAEWLKKNIGRFSFSAKGFTEMRRFIEIACAKNRNCTVDDNEDLQELKRRMDFLKTKFNEDKEGPNDSK